MPKPGIRVLFLPMALMAGAGLWALLAPGARSQAVSGYCSYPYKINWPTASPVWSLCWVSPSSSSGIDGSGLELRDVFYKGKRLFFKAHLPCLNVKYDPGGCGDYGDLAYRDWQWQLRAFQANNILRSGYAEPTTSPVTVCEHPGYDAGSFSGVAVEKRADRLILTTQMRSAWYRYIQKWTFFPDGTIQPTLGFTAVSNYCVSKAHTHHAYWRFDFDVDGETTDAIDETDSGQPWRNLPTETSRMKAPALSRKWRARDTLTGLGFEVIPGAADGVADSWAVADVWALRYKDPEIDDGGATSGAFADAIHINRYLAGESIDGQDLVMWYHAGVRHAGGADCAIVGPTLRPSGPW